MYFNYLGTNQALNVEVEHDCDYWMWFIKVIDLQTNAAAFEEVVLCGMY